MKQSPTTFELAQLAAQAAPANARPKDAVRRAMDLWHEAEEEIKEHGNRVDFLRRLFWTPNGKEIPIFTDTPKNWQARLKAYPGEERDVERAMWNQEFPAERVEKKLFPDKNIAVETKHLFTLALARVCINHDLEGPLVSGQGRLEYIESENGVFIDPIAGFPIHPKNRARAENHHRTICRGYGEMLIPRKEVDFVNNIQALLSKPKLNANLVRWAVEVRQKQVSATKPRNIPQSIKTSSDKTDHDDNIQVKKPYQQ